MDKNLENHLQAIGRGEITYNDYQEQYTYTEQRGQYTILVHGSMVRYYINLQEEYHIRIYTEESQKQKSLHHFHTTTIVMQGNQNTMLHCEDYVKGVNISEYVNNIYNTKTQSNETVN